MVLDLARGVVRTLLVLAGALALVVDAGLVAGAAPVFQADRDGGVAAVDTDADGLVVQHLALLAGRALPGVIAGVPAAATVTGLVGRTVGILAAFYLTIRAGEGAILVDNQAVLALTAGLATGDDALLVELAVNVGAGVNALVHGAGVLFYYLG